jgi:hypothetical protein
MSPLALWAIQFEGGTRTEGKEAEPAVLEQKEHIPEQLVRPRTCSSIPEKQSKGQFPFRELAPGRAAKRSKNRTAGRFGNRLHQEEDSDR